MVGKTCHKKYIYIYLKNRREKEMKKESHNGFKVLLVLVAISRNRNEHKREQLNWSRECNLRKRNFKNIKSIITGNYRK